jgi:HSF-type DNA-binding
MLITMHIEKMERISPGSTGPYPPVQWGTSCNSERNDDIIIFNDSDGFAAKVLPIFAFPSTSFKSFVRKMYRWGFRRAQPNDSSLRSHDAEPWAFFCDNFRRGDFQRLVQMISIDSRPKKPARSTTELDPPQFRAVKSRDFQSPGIVRRKRDRSTSPSFSLESSESVSVAGSPPAEKTGSTPRCTDSLIVQRTSYQPRPKLSDAGAAASSFDRKPAAVSESILAEVVVCALSGEAAVDTGSTRSLPHETRPSRGSSGEPFPGLQTMVPLRLVQAVMQPRNNANNQSNLRAAYLMALQLREPGTHQAAVRRLGASLPQSTARPLLHHLGQAANPNGTFGMGTTHPYQRQLLPGQQYPALLVPPHDRSLYGSLHMNTLLQPNSTQPFSSGQAPPLFSQASPSHLLESRQTSDFLAAAYIHSQQQIQRALLPVGMGSSSTPVANSAPILSNPTRSATFPLRPQPMTGGTPRLTTEGEINTLSLEQLLALHRARQGG